MKHIIKGHNTTPRGTWRFGLERNRESCKEKRGGEHPIIGQSVLAYKQIVWFDLVQPLVFIGFCPWGFRISTRGLVIIKNKKIVNKRVWIIIIGKTKLPSILPRLVSFWAKFYSNDPNSSNIFTPFKTKIKILQKEKEKNRTNKPSCIEKIVIEEEHACKLFKNWNIETKKEYSELRVRLCCRKMENIFLKNKLFFTV